MDPTILAESVESGECSRWSPRVLTSIGLDSQDQPYSWLLLERNTIHGDKRSLAISYLARGDYQVIGVIGRASNEQQLLTNV